LKGSPILFADDTCLLVKSSNSEQLLSKINEELLNLRMWCCVNKLTINPTKTNIVIIAPKRNEAPLSQLSLTTNGSQINIANFAKYLGVFIDKNLEFKQHIKVLESKWHVQLVYLLKSMYFLQIQYCNFTMPCFIRCCLMALSSGEPLFLLHAKVKIPTK